MSGAPFERRPQESLPAWAAFACYRDMGPTRSIAKVAQELTKSGSLLRGWSTKWNWVRRAEEWDAHLDNEYREWRRAEQQAMARRHAQLATAVQAKVVARLQTIDPEKLTATQLVQMLDVACKIERAALGEPMRLEHSGPNGGPIDIDIDLPDDEIALLAEMRTIHAALKDRLGDDYVMEERNG